jgi:hypothetical protein
MVQLILLKDQERRANEDDEPHKQSNCPDLDPDTEGKERNALGAPLLPGTQAGRRD